MPAPAHRVFALALVVATPVLLGGPGSGRAVEGDRPATAREPSALVQVAPVERLTATSRLTAYGTVEFSPADSQVVTLEGERVVTRVLVAAGQTVATGDDLLTVRATPSDQMELDRARIDVDFAKKDLERLRDLRVRQLATNAQVQAAEAVLAKAEAVLAGATKRLGGPTDLTVRADRAGVVESVTVREGDIVAPHSPLLRLARSDRLQVRLGVEPPDIQRLRPGQAVTLTPLHGSADPVTSQVTRVAGQVDPKTRLAEVVVTVPTAPGLVPGAVVRGTIVLAERPHALAVPRSAVLYEGARAYVFVVEQGRAVRRWVRVGEDDGRSVEIRQGLGAGDTVVSLGNYELRDGMAVRLQAGPR
ncbi:MAG TPA: efflux RND transporter periplasmic adaptor subunit [Methylomirabilota bacterium]|nr:efflux RND transporter periplasmic adaptor subunit [Methylomirabilota bacterium]